MASAALYMVARPQGPPAHVYSPTSTLQQDEQELTTKVSRQWDVTA